MTTALANKATWGTESLDRLIPDVKTGFPSGERSPHGVIQVRMNNVDLDGALDLTTATRVPADESLIETYRLERGDVLFNNTNSTELVGKTAVFPGADEPVLFSNHFSRLRVDHERLDPWYLGRWLSYQQRRRVFRGLCNRWVNQSAVRKEALLGLGIPIPFPGDPRRSLAEQKRIAAILDKADAIRRRRQEAARLADTLIPSVFYEMFGDPRANNNNLPLRPFGELATNEDGRRRPVKAFDRSMRSGPYPYYGASGIIDHVEEFIFDETTLLIAEDGANLLARSTPIAFIATGKYWVNNHAHVVTPNGQAELGYLETHLNLRDVTDFVTGSAQPKLTQANLNRLPVPYPPIEQQKEFAQRVRRVANLKKAQAVERSEAEQLFRSLVQRAFRGEL